MTINPKPELVILVCSTCHESDVRDDGKFMHWTRMLNEDRVLCEKCYRKEFGDDMFEKRWVE